MLRYTREVLEIDCDCSCQPAAPPAAFDPYRVRWTDVVLFCLEKFFSGLGIAGRFIGSSLCQLLGALFHEVAWPVLRELGCVIGFLFGAIAGTAARILSTRLLEAAAALRAHSRLLQRPRKLTVVVVAGKTATLELPDSAREQHLLRGENVWNG